jgi:hypothetical protein
MAKPMPPGERRLMPPYLSDMPGLKIIVACEQCGIRKRFDGTAMLERIDDDCNLPTLIGKIRRGIGCELALKWKNFSDPQCTLVYDVAEMDRVNAGIKHKVG